MRRPLPCLSEMSTRPDQDSRCRTKPVTAGEGRGFWWEVFREAPGRELASELSIKNEEKWQHWEEGEQQEPNREVEKISLKSSLEKGFSEP